MYAKAKYGGRHSKEGVPLDRITSKFSRIDSALRRRAHWMPSVKHRAPDGLHAAPWDRNARQVDEWAKEWWPGHPGRTPGKHHPDRDDYEAGRRKLLEMLGIIRDTDNTGPRSGGRS